MRVPSVLVLAAMTWSCARDYDALFAQSGGTSGGGDGGGSSPDPAGVDGGVGVVDADATSPDATSPVGCQTASCTNEDCPPGASCNFTCSDKTTGCHATCEPGSTCTLACDHGPCTLDCRVGATCIFKCNEGSCDLNCVPGSPKTKCGESEVCGTTCP
jgi:hypothetical protein